LTVSNADDVVHYYANLFFILLYSKYHAS